MFKYRIAATITLFLLILTLSCSKSTGPDPIEPPDTGPVGILLPGASSDPALSGTSNHGPFAVPENEWDGDFVTTRLEAVINPNTTVGTVNIALNSVGGKISCMHVGLMFAELVVPALPTVDSAKLVCSTLVASSAFLSAYPCFDPIDVNNGAVMPDFPASIRITPLEQAKFPAAWNLRKRAAGLHSPVTIVVADDFTRFTTHPEIPAQTFIPGIGVVDTLLNAYGKIDGNHGFAVAGTIGARYDDIGSTGAFADTANLLRLPCISMTRIGSWIAILAELYRRLPVSGKFILNTSWGYNGDFTRFSKRQRIEHAFFWRLLVAHRQNDFLQMQASGNDGFYSPDQTNADYNSPFTLTARFDTPRQMLQGTVVSPADTAALDTVFARIVMQGSMYATRLQNVLTVGSSDWDGNLSTFSNGPADVRMIGENITLPCSMGDGICGPGPDVAWQGSYDGTSFATPQVAALAGWLWALSPALTVDETRAIIMNCFYNNKWVDAYKAVLSLDHSIANAGIRLSLLDIADANGQKGSDMLFDEKDLKMFIDSILYYEADRGSRTPPWPRDHSPFDLNGDGYTGDTMLTPSTAPFDLDITTPPAYSTVWIARCDQNSARDTTLDERAVTDRDILLYYAFSDLYTGNSSKRDSLLGVSCDSFWVGHDSNMIVTISADPPYGPLVWDTSYGTSLSVDIDRRIDSLTPLCVDHNVGYHWFFHCGGSSDVSASSSGTTLAASGQASIVTSAQTSQPKYKCDYRVAGNANAYSSVHFAPAGDQNELFADLVVNGSVIQPAVWEGGSPAARCIVSFQVYDTMTSGGVMANLAQYDSDLHSLPFTKRVSIGRLSQQTVYRLEIRSFSKSLASTSGNYGPNEAKVEISASVFVGP